MAKKKEIDEEIDEEVGDINEEIVEEKKGKKEHFIIEEHDFKMESSRAGDIRFFDLYFMHTVNKGKENERKEFKLEGYGFQLKTCLRKIAAKRAGTLPQKYFNSFSEFVNIYLTQVKEIKKLFNILPNDEEY